MKIIEDNNISSIANMNNTNVINPATAVILDVGNVQNNSSSNGKSDDANAHHGLFGTMLDIKTQANRLVKDPFEQKMKILTATDGVASSKKEALYFFGATKLHGAFRFYTGKPWTKIFWFLALLCAFSLFFWQTNKLIHMLWEQPTDTRINVVIHDEGIDFPAVTICNYNPIRRSYIRELNSTGQFDVSLLNYLSKIYSQQIESIDFNSLTFFDELQIGENALSEFINSNPQFNVNEFVENSGLNCTEILRLCSFAGVEFDCCENIRSVLTDVGKCFQFDFSAVDSINHKQKQIGVRSGLQIVANYRNDEVIGSEDDDGTLQPIYFNNIEKGFRFFVHDPKAVSFLSTEGISVSPNYQIFASIDAAMYTFLPEHNWGNCRTDYPSDYPYWNEMPIYSQTNCKFICFAKTFYEQCGCVPFQYHLNHRYTICSPYDLFTCLHNSSEFYSNDTGIITLPACTECRSECQRWVSPSHNSYGYGFSQESLNWFKAYNVKWTSDYVRKNFVAISIFFQSLNSIEYVQYQKTSLTETLSDVGGNMGLFFGGSILTVIEVIILVYKFVWIAISKRRRETLAKSVRKEDIRKKQIDDAIRDGFQFMAKAFGGAALASSSENNTIKRPDDRERPQIPIFTVEGTDKNIVNNQTTEQNDDINNRLDDLIAAEEDQLPSYHIDRVERWQSMEDNGQNSELSEPALVRIRRHQPQSDDIEQHSATSRNRSNTADVTLE